MKISYALSALLVLVTCPSFANDTLKLKNGDVLSGTISNYSVEGVTITTSYGEFNIPINQIGGIESPMIDLNDLKKPEPPTPIIAKAEPAIEYGEPVSTDMEVDAEAHKTGLWGATWSGNINAGAEFKDGNSDSNEFIMDGQVKANWNDIHRLKIGAEFETEKENDVKTKDERELFAAYDYFFSDKWFWNNALELEQDKVNNLDLRTIFTSGLGYQIYDEDDLRLAVTFGPGYEREEFENQDAEDSLTANWALDYEQKFYDDFIRLFHNHDIVTPSDDFSSYLFESKSGLRIPLREGVIASGEVEFDWNNDPAIGEVEDDTTYRAKLGYEW
jgi:putative salt-induced outer membrane protein YdiY